MPDSKILNLELKCGGSSTLFSDILSLLKLTNYIYKKKALSSIIMPHPFAQKVMLISALKKGVSISTPINRNQAFADIDTKVNILSILRVYVYIFIF